MDEQNCFVSDVEAGRIMGVAPQSLRNWRCLGRGPAYSKRGGRLIRYKIQDLIDFMALGRIDPEARREGK